MIDPFARDANQSKLVRQVTKLGVHEGHRCHRCLAMTTDTSEGGAEAGMLNELFERAQALANTLGSDVHIVELLSVYVQFKPEHGVAWFYLGDALRHVGRYKEAESALSKAISLAPDKSRFGVYARMGMLFSRHGSPAEAEKWFRLATAEAGCPGWMWTLRGENLLRLEAHGLAKTCLEAAMTSADADKDEVLLNLALLARSQRQYSEARAFLEEALRITPDYEDAKALSESLSDVEKTIQEAGAVAVRLSGDRKPSGN